MGTISNSDNCSDMVLMVNSKYWDLGKRRIVWYSTLRNFDLIVSAVTESEDIARASWAKADPYNGLSRSPLGLIPQLLRHIGCSTFNLRNEKFIDLRMCLAYPGTGACKNSTGWPNFCGNSTKLNTTAAAAMRYDSFSFVGGRINTKSSCTIRSHNSNGWVSYQSLTWKVVSMQFTWIVFNSLL